MVSSWRCEMKSLEIVGSTRSLTAGRTHSCRSSRTEGFMDAVLRNAEAALGLIQAYSINHINLQGHIFLEPVQSDSN